MRISKNNIKKPAGSKKAAGKPDLEAIRHSISHIVALATLERFPKAKLGIGPTIENGFYYDFGIKEISEDNLKAIEGRVRELLKQGLKFKKEIVTPTEARKIFKDQPFKLELVDELRKAKKPLSVYKTYDKSLKNPLFIDLCAGPHVKSTAEIDPEAFKLTSIAGAYWRGNEKNPMLQRIYGLAFSNKKELDDYLRLLEEAEKRDHKKLGKELGIFFIDETAPGMPYWLPKGTIMVNELLKFWREEHKKRGYLETITPLLNKKQLYETSGHWDHYRENMFISDMGEDGVYCLKPMNCPNAMTIFKQETHSYRELPLRLSDCDTLHRHEKSGELNGLFRVQKFAQDDAHIFVTEEQISDEFKRILEIANLFYSIFDIKFKIRLGTKPDDYMGDDKTWARAEKELEAILKKNKFDYFIGQGEGAFYGPKLDILMQDSLGRQWQTGTIQLDFQLPRKFDLKYTDKDGKEKTPAVIHRVIYGSLERFMGILIEH
ncbi:MAG TPA: threonine--tRNA ligase, partial [Candidatus Colwellbacteria bacterium]|nr:threonine--tRNA ligase [Candidatus Colwellbacteria bacterium]